MASAFDGPLGAPPFSSDKPWVWAMIPVGFVIIVGAVALCLHSQRQRKHFEAGLASSSPNGGTRLDPAGTRALERDLEEAWVRGATPTRRPPPRHHRSGSGAPSAAAGRWTRPTSRWQWAGVSRPEEGLNELGEAPPPYEKKGNREGVRKSSSIDGNVPRSITDDDDSVELQNLTSPPPPPPAMTISRATASPISVYGNEMGENARIRGNLSAFGQPPPPAYEGDGTGSSTPISRYGRPQREDSPVPRPYSPPIGPYDDGTAIVSVTPVPAAVLPIPEHRSV